MSNAREGYPEEQSSEELRPGASPESERSLILRGDVIDALSEERLTSIIRALGLLLGGEIKAQVAELGRVRDAGEPFTSEDATALGWTQGEWERYLGAWGSRRQRKDRDN